MTSPIGGGQNINLAALWIPVLPDTSHIGEEMRQAGAEAKTKFEQGFNSSGSSPEQLSQSYVGKIREGMTKGFADLDIPFGGSKVANWLDQFSGQVDEKLVKKLKGEATQALREYGAEHEKLAQAQDRVTESENKLNVARDNGISKASIMMPLLTEQTAAHKALEEQASRTATAHDQLSSVTGKLHDEQGKAATSGQVLAGVVGGSLVAGVGLALKGVEEFVEFYKEGLEEGINLTKELGEQVIELGEKYEQIGIGVREFSGASGEAFDDLESRAQKVFGTLDVAGENTGQTFGQMTSILGEAIPDSLVKHVEELQGRFSNLRAQDVASIFHDFKVPAEETDSVLASLAESARNSGQGVGDLVAALKGDAAATLHEAGLNAQQAGAFIGDMMKMGSGGRTVMSGLQTAMKDFAKEGLTFGEGMKLAGQRLKELGDTAAGQELAEKLFGTRRWAIAMQAAQDYVDVIDQGPDAFNRNSDSLDQFLSQTETLENKWESLKHKAEEAMAPFGKLALGVVGAGLDHVATLFDENKEKIKAKVLEIGHSFIGILPDIKQFAVDALSFLAEVINPLKEMAYVITLPIVGFGQAIALLHGDMDQFNRLGDLGDKIGKLDDIDMSLPIKKAADAMRDYKINTGDLNLELDKLADHPPPPPIPYPGAGPNPAAAPGSSSGGWGSGSPGSSSGPSGMPWVNPLTGAPAPGAPAPGAPYAPDTSPPPDLAPSGPDSGSGGSTGKYHADWDAIAAKEGGGQWNITYTTGVPEGGGLQIKPDTWAQYGGLAIAAKPYLATKQDQEMIADRILNGWNGIGGQGPKAWENGKTYVEKHAKGGAPGRMITSGSGHGDDVAALLKKGEYVWDTDTMDKYGWLVTALHQGATGYDTGGSANSSNSFGRGLDSAILAGVPQGHYAEPGQERDNLAKGMADCSSSIEALIHHLEGGSLTAPTGMFTGNEAQFLAAHGFMPGEGGPGDFRVGFNSHHTQATLPGGTPFSWGSEEAAQNRGIGGAGADDPALTQHYYRSMRQGVGDIPGGVNGGLYPGLPGQYGGSGAYGGETADQIYQTNKAVQDAKDRASDMDVEIAKQQRGIDDLKAEMAKGDPKSGKKGLLGVPLAETPEEQAAWAEKNKKLNEQLSDATAALAKSQRERSEQDGVITEAQRKQLEATYKKPSGTGQSAEGKAGETLGQGLLGGIGQELGLGDVLGKSPLDWGIVKLFEGLLNYGNNLGDAVFGKSGGLGGPGSSGGLGPDIGKGVLDSVGIKLPTASVSAASNVIPITAAPGTPASGIGLGPLPGPPIINNDNSINVQAGVDDKTILGPVKAMQDSSNSASFQYTGGMPAQ